MSAKPTIVVEFYGVPRQRAECAELIVHAATVGGALNEVVKALPNIAVLLNEDGLPGKHLLLSIDGKRFCNRADESLQDGERLLIMSADSGG